MGSFLAVDDIVESFSLSCSSTAALCSHSHLALALALSASASTSASASPSSAPLRKRASAPFCGQFYLVRSKRNRVCCCSRRTARVIAFSLEEFAEPLHLHALWKPKPFCKLRRGSHTEESIAARRRRSR